MISSSESLQIWDKTSYAELIRAPNSNRSFSGGWASTYIAGWVLVPMICPWQREADGNRKLMLYILYNKLPTLCSQIVSYFQNHGTPTQQDTSKGMAQLHRSTKFHEVRKFVTSIRHYHQIRLVTKWGGKARAS